MPVQDTEAEIQRLKRVQALAKQKAKEEKYGIRYDNPYTTDEDMSWDEVEESYLKYVPLDTYQRIIQVYEGQFKTTPKKPKKLRCSCCGRDIIHNADKSLSMLFAANRTRTPFFYKPWCADCSSKLLEHYLKLEDDEVIAMRRWCCDTNTFWDVSAYERARIKYLKSDRETPLHSYYMMEIDVSKSFYQSDFIQSQEAKVVEICTSLNEDSIINEEAEYLESKRRILKLYRYDPFERKPEESKKRLYITLNNMLTPDVETDPIKQQMAADVAQQIEELARLQREIDELNQLKDEQQKKIDSGEIPKDQFFNYNEPIFELWKMRKEVNSVMLNQAKAYGLDDKGKGKGAKGRGTLSYTIEHMEAEHYEPSLANYLGVKWSQKFTELFNLSASSMMGELRLSDDDLFQAVKETQRKMREISTQNGLLQEQLRKCHLVIEEKDLVEKARRLGVRLNDEDLLNTYEAEGEFLD